MPEPPVEVDLEVSSWVEGRGVRHTNWAVRLNDAWVPVAELRDIAATLANPEVALDEEVDELCVLPPGCQYRKTYHPVLPIGTQVAKRVSTPRMDARASATRPATAGEATRQVIAAFPPLKPPLKTTVTEFRVGHRGRLVSEAEWQRYAEAAHR